MVPFRLLIAYLTCQILFKFSDANFHLCLWWQSLSLKLLWLLLVKRHIDFATVLYWWAWQCLFVVQIFLRTVLAQFILVMMDGWGLSKHMLWFDNQINDEVLRPGNSHQIWIHWWHETRQTIATSWFLHYWDARAVRHHWLICRWDWPLSEHSLILRILALFSHAWHL